MQESTHFATEFPSSHNMSIMSPDVLEGNPSIKKTVILHFDISSQTLYKQSGEFENTLFKDLLHLDIQNMRTRSYHTILIAKFLPEYMNQYCQLEQYSRIIRGRGKFMSMKFFTSISALSIVLVSLAI